MKMFRSLTLTLALMALPFAESFAADGLTALPDGGYVVEFNRLRIPIGGKSKIFEVGFLNFPKDRSDREVFVGDLKYKDMTVWEVDKIIENPDLFRAALVQAESVYFVGGREIDNSKISVEYLPFLKNTKKAKLSYGVVSKKTNRNPLGGAHEENVSLKNSKYVRDGFFGPNAPSIYWIKSSYRRNFYGMDVVIIENNYNFDDYDNQKQEDYSINSVAANERYFFTKNILYIECNDPSSSCNRNSYSRDGSIHIGFSFNKNIHRRYWLALDAYMHSVVPELFVGPVPEGIE